jgi:DNA-binding NtrC family response regulator
VLLRVLQEGEVTRIGSTESKPVDVRIIAATNRDLYVAMEQGTFRRDLFHRLSVLTIELPPLRERREDIPLLVERFLDAARTETRREGIRMDPDAVAVLQEYDWPGNVRELMNVVFRLVALATSSRIAVADLPEPIRRAGTGAAGGRRVIPLEREVERITLTDRGPDVAAAESDPELERLLRAIDSARTMAEAAARLGVTRSTLYRRLERYGLQPKRIFREK